jgi:general secretion pathway protein K
LACRILDHRGSTDPNCPTLPQGSSTLFAAPEELAELPGFGDRLYRAVADYVTVQTGASAIDPIVASRRVLLAVPGATPDLVDFFLSRRAMMSDLAPGGGFDALPSSPYLMMSPARDFTVSAVATTQEGARYRAELQVRLTGTTSRPYQVLAWRAPPPGR